MWIKDNEGTELASVAEAYKLLRERAAHTIVEGARHGLDLRQHHIRMRDNKNVIVFEGTLEEAACLETSSDERWHQSSEKRGVVE